MWSDEGVRATLIRAASKDDLGKTPLPLAQPLLGAPFRKPSRALAASHPLSASLLLMASRCLMLSGGEIELEDPAHLPQSCESWRSQAPPGPILR